MDYLDFELEIEPIAGRDYMVSVLRSPAGETQETMVFPFDELELENRLQALQIALLHSGSRRRKILSTEEKSVQEFGQKLFDAILGGEVRSLYDISKRESILKGMGLRLKFRFKTPELAALPWEFLYDSRQAEYVCLSRNNPLVRYLEIPQPIKPLDVELPLRILGMVAAPKDQETLDISREKQRIERAVTRLQSRGLVDLVWLNGQTWRDLQESLQGGPWHIFHFIGHGGFDPQIDEGLVVLANDEGNSHLMSATHLGRLLADHQALRLVLLNACEGARGSKRDIFSSTASILVRRGIPAVIAMQYEITDRAAIEFARSFYSALVKGMPVDTAVAEARKAISLAVSNSIEWGTPVLHLRAPDGWIFNMPKISVEAPALPDQEIEVGREKVQRLEDLYTQGLSSFWVEDWAKAVRYFQTIVDEDPDYEDAITKLEEAERQGHLFKLYDEAISAQDGGDWNAAFMLLKELVDDSPDFKDAAHRLEIVTKQKELADLYNEAQRLFKAEQWHAVVNVFAQISDLGDDHPDPDRILPIARQRVADLERQSKLEELYSRAVREMDARRWQSARSLLQQVKEIDEEYKATEKLFNRIALELKKEEEKAREEKVSTLYGQARRYVQAHQWPRALEVLNEIKLLDPQFADPEMLMAKTLEEIGPDRNIELEKERTTEKSKSIIDQIFQNLKVNRVYLSIGIVIAGIGVSISCFLIVSSLLGGLLPQGTVDTTAPVIEPPQTVVNTSEPTEPGSTAIQSPSPDVGFAVLPGGSLERAIAGEFAGTEVTVDGPFTNPDDLRLFESVAAFEDATDIKVNYIGDKEFNGRLAIQVEAGDPPDIANFPQQVTAANFAQQGYIVDPTTWIPQSWLEQQYNQSWLDMSMVEGPDGSPMSVGVWHRFNTTSLVWYPKKDFDARGYAIPSTWQELLDLTQTIADDGDTAWCIGIESGSATGWVATHWTEDLMLRTTSLQNYDAWVAGTLAFASPEVANAIETWSEIWFNPDYVYGGTDAIVSIYFGDSPAPMFEDPPKCWLHRQGSFITGFFPEGTELGVDYDFFFFPPVDDAYGRPFLVAGNIMSMFNDRPEVRALMEYFTTPQSVAGWLQNGGALAAHQTATPDMYGAALERGIATLVAEATSFRGHASNLMPAEVGYIPFWNGMTLYVTGEQDLDTVLRQIDAEWP